MISMRKIVLIGILFGLGSAKRIPRYAEEPQGSASIGYGSSIGLGDYGAHYGGYGGYGGGGLGYGGYGGGGLGYHGSSGLGYGGYGGGIGHKGAGYGGGNYLGGGYGGYGVGSGHGYGGYGLGSGLGYGGYNGIGYGGYGGYGGGLGGYGGYGGSQGLGGGYGLHHGGIGGGLEKSGFAKGGSAINDESYQKGSGQKGQASGRLAEGLSAAQAAENDAKGQTGHYTDVGSARNGFENSKAHGGVSHYDQSGKKGGEGKTASGHRKGHATKGFETSHHKDETGKTTTFFDEANDEGDQYNYGGQHGSYGDKAGNTYHNDHLNNKFNADQHAQKGHFDQGHVAGKENADKLAYGNRVYYDNNNQFGEAGGTDRQSVLGHSEANKFYKHHPHYY